MQERDGVGGSGSFNDLSIADIESDARHVACAAAVGIKEGVFEVEEIVGVSGQVEESVGAGCVLDSLAEGFAVEPVVCRSGVEEVEVNGEDIAKEFEEGQVDGGHEGGVEDKDAAVLVFDAAFAEVLNHALIEIEVGIILGAGSDLPP